jgi:hypothetical protein
MTTVGLITVGQAPRSDVVPDMAAILGGDVEIVEAGALDGLTREQIAPLAPEGDDEILVTRLADGSSVFVGKTKMIPRIEAKIAALEDRGVALNVLLCTGEFPKLRARRPFLEPQQTCPRPSGAGAPAASTRTWPRCRPTRRTIRPRSGARPGPSAPAPSGSWSWTA